MSITTWVATTAEESSPGVPSWGPHQNATKVPPGATDVAIENLVAGRRYYVKTWNEDEFGNKSPELLRVVETGRPTKTIPYSFSANGYLDSGSPMRAFIKVPSDVQSVSSVAVTLAFRQFMAPATAAAASGTLTSDSGGGSTSGASSSSTSGAKHLGLIVANDFITLDSGSSGAASAGTAHTHGVGSYVGSGAISAVTDVTDHDHTITHTHTTPAHDHTVPTHTHALTYGTFEETYPVSHSVTVSTYQRVLGAWTLMDTQAGLTDDLVDLDLTDVITGPGDWRIEVVSAAAQPNGGRLGCDLFGALEVVV